MVRFEINRKEPGSIVTTLWNPKSYMELVTSECGLAKAFGLMYMDECRGLQGHD